MLAASPIALRSALEAGSKLGAEVDRILLTKGICKACGGYGRNERGIDCGACQGEGEYFVFGEATRRVVSILYYGEEPQGTIHGNAPTVPGLALQFLPPAQSTTLGGDI